MILGTAYRSDVLNELSLELEEVFEGRVDIITKPLEHMLPAFRKSIEQDEVRIYEA